MSTLNRTVFLQVLAGNYGEQSAQEIFDSFIKDYPVGQFTHAELVFNAIRTSMISLMDIRDESVKPQLNRLVGRIDSIPEFRDNALMRFVQALGIYHLKTHLNCNDFDNNHYNTAVDSLIEKFDQYTDQDFILMISLLVKFGYIDGNSLKRFMTFQELGVRSSSTDLMRNGRNGEPESTGLRCADNTKMIDTLTTGVDYDAIMSLNGRVLNRNFKGVTLQDLIQWFTVDVNTENLIGNGCYDKCTANVYFEKILSDSLCTILRDEYISADQLDEIYKNIIRDTGDVNESNLLQHRMVIAVVTTLNYLVALSECQDMGDISNETQEMADLLLQLDNVVKKSQRLMILPNNTGQVATFCDKISRMAGCEIPNPNELNLRGTISHDIYKRIKFLHDDLSDTSKGLIEPNEKETGPNISIISDMVDESLTAMVASLTEGF